MGNFAQRVFAVVKRIPSGKVATYGQVARMIGAPRSARYVGYALRANPAPGSAPDSIPCHRVVFKDGAVTDGFAFGGPDMQRRLLEREGVGFDDKGRVLMDVHQWSGDDGVLPEGIDWEREFTEHPLHDCETCSHPRPDCPRSEKRE